MSFTQELILFASLCIALRVSGSVLEFIAKWASAIRRDTPQPLGHPPPRGETKVSIEPVGV